MLEITTIPRAKKVTVKDGFIPAVYYGAHAESTPIFIDTKQFTKVYSTEGTSNAISLITEHGKENALIHEVQRHPVKNHPIHVDFYVIEKGQKVHVKVPITFVGESAAVKAGGVLVKVLHEVSVEGDPTKIPHDITVDITTLLTNENVITLADVKLPAGVTLYHAEETDVIASIAEAVEEVEAPQEVDLAAIEVEKKGKKEEEGEAAAE